MYTYNVIFDCAVNVSYVTLHKVILNSITSNKNNRYESV